MLDQILLIINKIRPELEVSKHTKLISDDFLDSLDLIQLVSELDSQFNISIEGEDITESCFDSVESIEKTIKKYQNKVI